MQVTVYGLSSKESVNIDIYDLEQNLLDFLRANNFPVASSCRGEGICKLCTVNEKTLSCKITLRGFIEKHGRKILISYL